jgi:hypothetical protein
MTTPRRTVLKDEFDRVTVQWQERGPTDYFHAEVYDLIATEVVKFRVEYDKLVREEWWQLDDVLDFQRSRVNDPYDMTYRPGPEEPDFDAENRDDTDWWEWG